MNAIEPLLLAEIGLPEGAKITETDSTMSTYSSFDVCRTLGRLHGIAGAFDAAEFAFRVAARLEGPRAGDELSM